MKDWYPVRTNALASVSIEEMAQIESAHIAKIAIDVSEYNSNYIDGATSRIAELKIALIAAITMLLVTNYGFSGA